MNTYVPLDDADAIALESLGRHVKQWRVITGVSQTILAERAGISVPALRRLESGDGSVRLATFVAVLDALQLAQRVVETTDPLATDVGRLRAHLLGRERAPR